MADDEPSGADGTAPKIGSYLLVEPLGSGGMSSVFRAQHVETGVEVAVKILPRTLARNKTLLQRFLREAKSAEALEHPNIVAIYDHGVDNGQYYLVLEFVSGGDLHDWVRKVGPMPVAEAVGVIKSVAEGLSFAASQGLIHRDVKPANLLRTPEGTIKIADLGLALQAEAEDERVTREGTTVGTVDYMAPEQARDSRGTSERSDIYSLGCTLYYLLTGQPPYPGGDVTSKLSRHFTAPAPDPADFRPDIPPKLTQVLRKMMAKRPENRFANYQALIAALDSLVLDPVTPQAPTETLDAIFDDDDDASSSFEGGSQGGPSGALDAVFDDEDDEGPASDGFLPLADDLESLPVPDGAEQRTADLSMADLASMDVDDDAPPVARPDRDIRPTVRRAVASATGSSGAAPAPSVPDAEEDVEQAVVGKMPGQVAFSTGRVMSAEERRWLKGLVLGGVGLIVAVIAFHQLYRSTVIEPTHESAENDSRQNANPEPVEPSPEPTPVPVPVPGPGPKPKAVATVAKSGGPNSAAVAPKTIRPMTPTVTTLPVVPPAVKRREPVFGADVEARFRPDWAAAEIPVEVAGKLQNVRRLADPGNPAQKSRLSAALEVIGNGTVEISDNGPFFEDDLRVSGDVRLIRAREGFRPILCFETPRLAVLAQQPAFLDLEARTLILDGLDLIVDVKDLPRNFASLFLCRGGALTLRNCTLTVVNRGGLPISLVQTVEGARPSRVRFERCTLRGSFTSAVDIASGAADVVFSRCAIVNGHGSAVTSTISGAGDRRVFLTRTVCATRGPAFELAEPRPESRAHPLVLRALATSFVHLAAPGRTSVIASLGNESMAADLVNWQGDANTFAGWSDWLSAGVSHKVLIADLSGVRETWSGQEAQSVETSAARPLAVVADRAGPDALRDLAPDLPDTLSHLAVPSPMIHEKTLEPFPHPVVPGLTTANGVPLTTPFAGPAVVAVRGGIRELTFDAEGPPLSGDLGRFLASNLRAGDTLVRVAVTGVSPHAWTPVKVPDGVSLIVDVVADPLNRSPSWSPAKGAPGEALISARGGSLVLSGVRFLQAGTSGLKCLVKVEDGHLLIHRSRLSVRSTAEAGAGGLIEYRAIGTTAPKIASAASPAWPFETRTDRPTCRVTETVLITGGVAVSAEVNRGLVALSQCAVAAGPSAFRLIPAAGPRERLEADLWIDHCTIASEHAFVTLEPWKGEAAGPDRPWLVSTHRSGFFAAFEHRAADSVLLRVDADSFARGVCFWQTSGDAFEVANFAASRDSVAPSNHRADVSRQWADLWGRAHVRSVTGPHPPASTMTRWLVTRVLKPGEVQPGDLAVDPSFPKDDPPRDLGVDLARLRINASARTPRKR